MALALQADGWYLRSDIIWHKPNPMPESVTDRPTKSHEYIFLLTKSASYFYDAEAVREPQSQSTIDALGNNTRQDSDPTEWKNITHKSPLNRSEAAGRMQHRIEPNGRNRRSVWTVPSQAYSEAHFATFPEDLIKPCILAGTSARGCCPKCGAPWERMTDKGDLQGPGYENYKLPKAKASKDDAKLKGRSDGWWPNHKYETKTIGWQPTCECGETEAVPCTVIDPFGGSGTTGQVAIELGRRAILIELNPEYVRLIERRTHVTPGLALA